MFPAAEPERETVSAIHHLCSGLMTDKLLGTGTMSRDHAVALATRFALATLRSDT